MPVRYDKYSGVTGGFRAPLAAAITDEDQIGALLGVGINGVGRAVIGAGDTGIVGVYVADSAKRLLEVADVMTSGEIVGDLDGFDPGDVLYSDASGVVTTTNTGTKLGYIVADQSTRGGAPVKRLVVRV